MATSYQVKLHRSGRCQQCSKPASYQVRSAEGRRRRLLCRTHGRAFMERWGCETVEIPAAILAADFLARVG